MKPYHVLMTTWFFSGVGGFLGSVFGGAVNKTWLFIGGFIGGAMFASLSAHFAARRGWIPPESRWPAAVGAAIGFLLAATLTVTNLDSPVMALVSPVLAGTGLLLGAGFGRR